MNNKFYVFILCIGVTFLLGCEKINLLKSQTSSGGGSAVTFTRKGTIIAKINNYPITLEDLNEEVEAFNANAPSDKPELKVTTRDKKIEYLKNEMVRRVLLYQHALALGLDRKDEVVQALEKTRQGLLVVELIKTETEGVEPTSAEIEDFYNKAKGQLKEPEEREISEIVVTTEQEAKDVLIQLLQGADFSALAKERSKAASAKSGGKLGFIKPGKKSAQFDSVAFADNLEIGKVSSIFKGPDGYYVLKLEGKRGGAQKSLSEMWEDIKRGLTFLKQQKKIEDLIGKLSREAKLEFYEGEIK